MRKICYNLPWKRLLCLFILSQMMMSCLNQNHSDNRIGSNEYSFKLGEEKSFLLDSTTTQETNYIQIINNEKFAIYNEPVNTICIYDIASGLEIEKIQLYEEGPNAMKGIQGFYYQSDDSIWVYRSWQEELFLLNSNGEIKEKRTLKDKLYPNAELEYSVSPFPLTDLPIMKDGNILILQGMNGASVKNDLQPASTILYDLVSDRVSLVNRYPLVYGDGEEINDKWGTFSYRVVPYTLNMKHEMLISYPAADSISIYNLINGKQQRFFAGYSQDVNIKPLQGISTSDLQKHYLEQYQYAGIFYDKYRDLYYRLVVLPIFDYDINDEKSQHKPLAIIVLDSSLNKVGEYNLAKGIYKYRNAFVSKEGLHINVYSEDDDYLKFITLQAVKKEK